MNPETIIKSVLNGKLKLKEPCNLQQNNSRTETDGFNYEQFLDDYAHGACDSLAFWLHDNYGLKIGAIRAIDMNDEDDTDYETVVHQFVYFEDKTSGVQLLLDARGLDHERAMLDYYKETSLFDDEEWDFMMDYDYKHRSKEEANRTYEQNEVSDFNKFFNLLGIELKKLFQKEKILQRDNDSSFSI